MPEMNPRTLRIVIPLLVGAAALGMVLMAVLAPGRQAATPALLTGFSLIHGAMGPI